MSSRARTRTVVWISTLLLLASCTTYRAVSLERVDLGDDVRVETTDGRRIEFEVSFVGSERIGGQGVALPVEEIEAIELRGPSLLAMLLGVKQTRFVLLAGLLLLVVAVAL